MANRHRRLLQHERHNRAMERKAKKERKKMAQQRPQLMVLAEAKVLFKPEYKKILGEGETFRQVGMQAEGPFLKFQEVSGPSHLFHFETILRVDTIPATIRPADASEMPG